MTAKPKVVHRKKLFGGRQTAEEVHQQHAFPKGAKCVCGRKPLIRAITFASFADASKHYPDIATMDPNMVGKILVQLKGSDGKAMPCVRLGVAYSCLECEKTMSHQLARLPSWVLVEINRGPGRDKVITSGG